MFLATLGGSGFVYHCLSFLLDLKVVCMGEKCCKYISWRQEESYTVLKKTLREVPPAHPELLIWSVDCNAEAF